MNRRHLLLGGGAALVLAGAGTLAWRSATGTMASYERYAARLREPLPADPQIADLLRYATLAANSHNTQPWQFRAGDGVIEILPDAARRTPAVDPDDHHLFVSLGCAAENLAIAARATGQPGDVEIDPAGAAVRYRFGSGAPMPDPLLAAIAARQSTRGAYDGRPVTTADMEKLAASAVMPGVGLILISDRAQMDQVRDLVVAGNTAQMADPAFMAELKHWLRFSYRSAMASGDGLFSATSGNPVLPDAIGGLAFDRFFSAAAENEKYARHIDSSAGIAVFVAEVEDKAHWIALGQACQRFALTATSLGMKHAFINQPVEVAALRPEMASLIGVAGKRPDIVMRFGYGPALPASPRRPVEAVLLPTA